MMKQICAWPDLPATTSPHVAYGVDLAWRAQFSDLAEQEKLAHVDPCVGSPRVLVCYGAYQTWASICDSFRKRGVTFSISVPTLAAIRHLHETSITDLLAGGLVLRGAVKGLLAAGYTWSIAAPEPKPEPVAPPVPLPQEIRIIGMPAITIESVPAISIESVPAISIESVPAISIESVPALSVESMPARKTESTVERDGRGNITRTTQKETDA